MAYGETAGTIQNVRHAPLNTKRKLSDDDFKIYGKKLTNLLSFVVILECQFLFIIIWEQLLKLNAELDLL